MGPLPLYIRRIIAFVFGLLFFIVLAVVLVYATGYRLVDRFTLEQTGGVHISIAPTNAILSINGEEMGVSSFLNKSFFLDHLPHGAYEIAVQKEGYIPWKKTLIVERSLVTGASAFMVPSEVVLLEIVSEGDSSTISTTTRLVAENEYDALLALFKAPTSSLLSATATTTVENVPDPIERIIRDGNVYVHWNRDLSRAPNAFCVTPRACVVEISVELSPAEVVRAEFFREGIVYQTSEGSVYFSEIDVKQPQITALLFEAPGAEFRIYKDEMIIKDAKRLFVVVL
jgi:hypothetical protein